MIYEQFVYQIIARPGLDAMEQRLDGHQWMAAEHPTIADLACYPYVSLAHAGRFSLQPYRRYGLGWDLWKGLRAGCRGWVTD
ncbi:MAG: hypothetical protein LJE70_01870 [Chromatiaceae bacterium]|nr:hypothetical protein [Chromatiaceae bacterium]